MSSPLRRKILSWVRFAAGGALILGMAFHPGQAWPFSSRHESAPGPLKIQFWHSMAGEKGQLLESLVQEFNALPANRGKREVDLQFIGSYEEGLNKLRTALLAGRGPHVVQVNDVNTRLMIDSGAVTPLDDFVRQDPGFPRAALLPQILHYYEVSGKLYSLPFATSCPVLYYNADALKAAGIDSPPTTFAALEQDAGKLARKESHVTGITWPIYSWFFEEFLARQGALLADHENGRAGRAFHVNYVSPEAVRFVSLWVRMVHDGSFANVGRGWDPAEQNFLAGRSAMLITSTSDVFELLKLAPFKLGIAPIPVADTQKSRAGGVIVGGNSLWIMNRPPRVEQEAAYLFLKFMASLEVQEKWHRNTGYFPIRTDAIEKLKREGFYARYPGAWIAIEQLERTPDNPVTRGALLGPFQELREQISSAIEEALGDGAREASVLPALTRAEAKSDASLKRYNRRWETHGQN